MTVTVIVTVRVTVTVTVTVRVTAGFSLQFFLWESLGLLQPKVEGPEEKVGGPMVSIEQRTRTKIKAML